MPPRGLENRLPPEVREWLEGELIRRGFADYSALTEELAQRLDDAGAEPVSRSAVYRFGSKIEGRIAALKRSTEMAKALATNVEDDAASLNDSLIRVAQDKLFDVLVDTDLDPESNSMSRLIGAIRDMSHATVQQKKHQRKIQSEAVAELKKIEAEARAENKTDALEVVRRLRGIYGLPTDQ